MPKGKRNKKEEDTPIELKDPKELEEETKKNIEDFDKLLETMSSLDDKRKSLWKQIYTNAVTDRRNTYIMFSNLYLSVHGNAAEHAIHGPTLAKYMERLNKSNEQLIKLAQLVDAAVEAGEDDMPSEDDIYETLGNMRKKKDRAE